MGLEKKTKQLSFVNFKVNLTHFGPKSDSVAIKRCQFGPEVGQMWKIRVFSYQISVHFGSWKIWNFQLDFKYENSRIFPIWAKLTQVRRNGRAGLPS